MLLSGVFGIVIGIILGLTGAGGGILAIPALVIGLGWTMTQSIPIALLAVSAAATIGAVEGLRKGLVRYRAALLMALLGAIFAPLGVYIARWLPSAVLMPMFSLVMIIVAVRMIFQRNMYASKAPSDAQSRQQKNCMLNPETGHIRWTLKCSTTLAVIGSLSGLLTGMLGVGGGFLLVPAFQKASDVKIHGIVATSLMVIALISATTALGAIYAGAHVTTTGAIFIFASIGGMLLGRALSSRVSGKTIQLSFSIVCILVASYLLVRN